MASYIARALIGDATWESIQARPYDGTRYPCGCHPDPKEPHRRFYLCDYHDGFDAGVDQGCHELRAEVERLRAENDAYRQVYIDEAEFLEAFANWDGTRENLPHGWKWEQWGNKSELEGPS